MPGTFSHNYTTLSYCENSTGWTGNMTFTTGSYEGKEGTTGLELSTGSASATPKEVSYGATSFDITSEDLVVWFFYVKGKGTQYLYDDNALMIRVYDSSGNWGEWNFGGHTNLQTGWQVLIASGDSDDVYAESTTAPSYSAINRFGLTLKFQTDNSGSGESDLAMDYWRRGNSIEFYGGTSGAPVTVDDWEDNFGFDTAHGIVEYQDKDISNETIVTMKTGVQFGDGTNSTVFTETNKVFYNRQISDDVEHDWLVEANATVNLGTKVTAGSLDFASDVCPLIMPAGKRADIIVDGSSSYEATLNCYGSLISGWDTIQLGDSTSNDYATVELLEVDFTNCNQIEFRSATITMTNSKVHDSSGTYGARFYVAPTTNPSGNKFFDNPYGITLDSNITLGLEDTVFSGNSTYDAYFNHSSGTATLNLIDSTDNITASQLSQNWNLYEKTTYNLKLTNSSGTGLNTATARLENTGGTQVFSLNTNSSGDIAEQEVTRRTRQYTGSLSTTSHNPFELRLRKYDYIPQEISGKNFGAVAISDTFALLDDPVASTAEGTVSGWSGITINEATSPDTIELSTTSRSLTQVFEYLRYYTALTGNMDLSDPIQSVDGVNFTISDYDFDVDTVTLTGSSLVLSMPTRDFTTSSGGSQSLKKLTDIDGTQVLLEINGIVQNTQCYIVPSAGGSALMNEAASESVSGNEYKATESYLHTSDVAVDIKTREMGYLPFETTGTVTDEGLTITAVWQVDPNWKLVVSGVNISFTNPSTITRASGSFVTDGWLSVMGQVTVEGSASNDGTYSISVVAATTLTITGGTVSTASTASGITLTFTRIAPDW